MKCKRRKLFPDQTWAQAQKKANEYKKRYWKESCPYSTRWKTCALAYHKMNLARFRRWFNSLPNNAQKNTKFMAWVEY